MIKFSVIICNYNGQNYLKDCLSSVSKTLYPKFETVVIDDDSSDGSLRIIEQFSSKLKIKLIRNRQNIGLVKSRNKAINVARGEVLVFLDNDAAVDKHWLKGLEEVFRKDQTVGAAQCKIFDFVKRDRIQEVGMKLVPFTGFGATIGRGERDTGQYDHPQEIIALGAALAVRKKVAQKIKGFDSMIFHYTDDLDFSWRVWISGLRVVSAPSSKVYHLTKEHRPNNLLYYHLTKNSLTMLTKNYQFWSLVYYLPFCIILNLAGGVYVMLTRGSLMGIWGSVLGLCWYLQSLPDILQSRERVQRIRAVGDSQIRDRIMVKNGLIHIKNRYFK